MAFIWLVAYLSKIVLSLRSNCHVIIKKIGDLRKFWKLTQQERMYVRIQNAMFY